MVPSLHPPLLPFSLSSAHPPGKQQCTRLLLLNYSSLELFLALGLSPHPPPSQPISTQHRSPVAPSQLPPCPFRTRPHLALHPMVFSPLTILSYTSKHPPSLAWVLTDSYHRRVQLQLPTGAARIPQVLHLPRHPLPGTCSHTSSIYCHLSFKTSPHSCTTRLYSHQLSLSLSPSHSPTLLRSGPFPDRTASSSTIRGPPPLSPSSRLLLLIPSSTTSAVEGQDTSRSPPITDTLASPAAPWGIKVLHLNTRAPLAQNNIGP